MTNLRALALIPTLLVGTALAGDVEAQPVQQEQAGVAFTGKVLSVDAKAKTLRVRGANGEEGVFLVDEKDTTIMDGSQEVAFSDLNTGDWISVDADTRGSQKVATYIEIVDEPSRGSQAGEGEAMPGGATIEVRHNKLSPAVVQLHAGETVTFHNIDKMPGGHTVVATDGAFSSPALGEGESWTHSFDVPGVYTVRIEQHPGAEARIVVE